MNEINTIISLNKSFKMSISFWDTSQTNSIPRHHSSQEMKKLKIKHRDVGVL